MATRLGESDGYGLEVSKEPQQCKPNYQKTLTNLLEKKKKLEKYLNMLNEMSVDKIPSEIKHAQFNLCELIGFFVVAMNKVSVTEAELLKLIAEEKADGTK